MIPTLTYFRKKKQKTH